MAKRKGRSDKEARRIAARSAAQIEDVPFAEATRTRYLNYALSVITSRALPDIARRSQAGPAPHFVRDVA